MDLPDVLELAGTAAVLVAAFALDWRVGLLVVGIILFTVGLVLDGAGDAR